MHRELTGRVIIVNVIVFAMGCEILCPTANSVALPSRVPMSSGIPLSSNLHLRHSYLCASQCQLLRHSWTLRPATDQGRTAVHPTRSHMRTCRTMSDSNQCLTTLSLPAEAVSSFSMCSCGARMSERALQDSACRALWTFRSLMCLICGSLPNFRSE